MSGGDQGGSTPGSSKEKRGGRPAAVAGRGAAGAALSPELRRALAELTSVPTFPIQRQLAELSKVASQHYGFAQQAGELSRTLSQVAGVAQFSERWGQNVLSPSLRESLADIARVLPQRELSRSVLGAGPGWYGKLLDVDGFGAAQHALLGSVLDTVKLSEALLPARLGAPGMVAASQLSRLVLSESAFTQWRASLGVQDTLTTLSKNAVLGSVLREQLVELQGMAAASSELAHVTSEVLGSRSVLGTRPMLEFEGYLNGLAAHPSRLRSHVAWSAGHGVSGLVAHDTLVAVRDRDEAAELTETVEEKVVAPWEEAASRTRHLLYERLDEFDPRISELLRGAWHSVAHPGPADIVKVGTCTVEALLWALRMAAPDEKVKAWLTETGRRVDDFVVDGKVTRSARVRFVLRDRKGDIKIVEAQAAALDAAVAATHSRLQAAKHASEGDLVQVRSHLLTTEALLNQLFAAG